MGSNWVESLCEVSVLINLVEPILSSNSMKSFDQESLEVIVIEKMRYFKRDLWL